MEPKNLTKPKNLDSNEISDENTNCPCKRRHEEDETTACDEVDEISICGEIINNTEMKNKIYVGSKRSRSSSGEMVSTKACHDDKNNFVDNLEDNELLVVQEIKNKFTIADSDVAKYANLSDTSFIKMECLDQKTNVNDVQSSADDSSHDCCEPSNSILRKDSLIENHIESGVLDVEEKTAVKETINETQCANLKMANVKLEDTISSSSINVTINQHSDHDEKNYAELEPSVGESVSEYNYPTPSCSHDECVEDKCIVLHDVEFEEITVVDEIRCKKHDVNPEIVKVKLEHSDRLYCNDSKLECSDHEETTKNKLQNSVNDEVAILYEHVVNNKFGSHPNVAKEESRYYCKECDISANSIQTYESHLRGKKHRTNTQYQMSDPVEHRFPRFQDKSLTTPVEYQTYERDTSVIQNAAENLKCPCPALNYVTEIQGLKEACYWCKLCHAMYYLHEILSHLNDFGHKMKCLKLFDFGAYKRIRSLDKCEAEYRLPKILNGIIRQHGFGKITIEKRSLDNENRLTPYTRHERKWNNSNRPFNNQDTGYTFRGKILGQSYSKDFDYNYSSTGGSSYKKSNYRTPNNIFISSPDASKFNFYCQICDVHMKNNFMWQSHMRSARHISNFNKEREGSPLELKSFKIPNARAKLTDQIDEMKVPVVGLDSIQETYDADLSLYRYKCFLCGTSSTPFDIIDHIISVKHREKFLEKIEYAPFEDVKTLNLSDWNKESLITEMCENIEVERGRGNIEVCTTDANYQSQAA